MPRQQSQQVKRLQVAVDIGGSKIAILAREIGSERDVYSDKLKTPADDGVEAILRLLDAQIDNLLDPEAIRFGGGTSKAGEALLERVRRRVAARLELRARLMPAGLGSDSQLFAALWGVEKLMDQPHDRQSAEKRTHL